MSYCLNPRCLEPQNLNQVKFCATCGWKLLVGDRYRAIKPIGQGGFGRTFLALDEGKPSQPPCVIKQFFPQAHGTNTADKAAQLFQQEAVRLDDLGKHPQIPELLAYLSQDEQQYLIQEFIDGQNLAEVLAYEEPFNETQIRQFLNDLLPVLQFIHAGQVIHRDIKPANIIRRRANGQLVLVDFGAAKLATLTSLERTGTSIGSALYTAPEQYLGKAVFASDIYSLGITAIHLLTQKPPSELFDSDEDDWNWRGFLTTPISDSLGKILDQMLERAIKRRYQSAEAVLADLNSVFEETTAIVAKPAVSQPAGQDWIRREILRGHSWGVTAIAISPDGGTLVSGSRDNTVKLWDLPSGKLRKTLNQHQTWVWTVATSPDNQIFASGSGDKTIKLWRLDAGEELRSLRGHTDAIWSLAFSPDGKILASSGMDCQIKLWNVSTGELQQTLVGHSQTVCAVAFSPDGQTLISSSNDKTVKFWDWQTGKEQRTLTGHLDWVRAIALTPHGQILASGSVDTTIKLWNFETGELLASLEGHRNAIGSLAVSPDGQILASGSRDKKIILWHLPTGECLSSCSGHNDGVDAVVFSPDGKTLFSGCQDSTIAIWERN